MNAPSFIVNFKARLVRFSPRIDALLTPNNLTLARLGLSAGFFVLLAYCKPCTGSHWIFDVAVAVFILAGLTDAVDGYLARKLGMVTTIGRMLDPFVDKVMICGTFIFFLGSNFVVDGKNVTDVTPWIVILIAARELLVTTLRGHSEAQGLAFPASAAGKIKMFFQSATVVAILISVGHYCREPWARNVRLVFLWAMVISTLVSMSGYIMKYISLNKLFESPAGPEDTSRTEPPSRPSDPGESIPGGP